MIPAPNLNLPWAQRNQPEWDNRDYVLADYARLRHPTVAWWWGGRLVDGTFGAWCYLCERHIVTWSRAWPVTQEAQHNIIVHRSAHLDGTIPTPGVNAAVKSAAADAAPAGAPE